MENKFLALILLASGIALFVVVFGTLVIQDSFQEMDNPCSDDNIPMKEPASEKIKCVSLTDKGNNLEH